MSIEPWPLDSTKRSRSNQPGSAGLCLTCRPHSATAMSAMPMGAPGWPEFACCTASMANARIAFAIRDSLAIRGKLRGVGQGKPGILNDRPGATFCAGALQAFAYSRGMKGLLLTADLYRC